MENKGKLEKKGKLKILLNDIFNQTSHSVDYLLSNKVEDTLSRKGIKIRKLVAPLLRIPYKTQSKYKLKIDSRSKLSKDGKPKIFVINHRQADDIVLGVNAVNESGYIVFGNKHLALETSNGLGLWAYGMILVDRNDQNSRKSSYEKMKYVVENNGNIIVYPEGYWNLDDNGMKDEKHNADDHNSESWLIQDMNWGAIKLAKETGTVIVPITMHYDEVGSKKCYAVRGEEFIVGKQDDIAEKTSELKEIMQTTYYNLMEKYSSYTRKHLESKGKTLKQQWKDLKKELVADCDIDHIEYKLDLSDEKLIGKAKVVNDITTNEEAFSHLKEIQYNKDNAFLLSKKLTGLRK